MSLITPFEASRERLRNAGRLGPWIVVFDIDSTIMDTSARNQAILRAAIQDLPELANLHGECPDVGNSWNILEPLSRLRLFDQEALKAVHDYWVERFFTNHWLEHDQPYPGVARCLATLKARGFSIVYLTGRHRDGMEEGTRTSFHAHGLPAGAAEVFLFKPRFEDSDIAFKTAACAAIADLGTVIGTVDNEPGNVNLFVRTFPEAHHVWMRTITSPNADALVPGVIVIGPEAFLAHSQPGLKNN